MKTVRYLKTALFIAFASCFLSSCYNWGDEDPGPLQNDQKDYSILDFDRLEMGDAFAITVRQGSEYSIHVSGDRRNLDDLQVRKMGGTLKIDFDRSRNRKHTTFIVITMPELTSATLSGASNSDISGFKSDNLELNLSGASISQISIESKHSTLRLSGASKMTVSGKAEAVTARVSGASELYAYSLPADDVDADASGASKINIYASHSLKATASGASAIYYRGKPLLNTSTSGASTIKAD